MEDTLEKLKQKIECFYKNKSGNTLGWRLLSSPISTVHTADIAFIGMNPGGSKNFEDHSEFCMSSGLSAYRDEKWGDNLSYGRHILQQQVLELFSKLSVKPHDVLSGNFVPFRSPNWKALNNKSQCLQFSRTIWQEIFSIANPKLVIAMGGDVISELSDLLHISDLRKIPTGWGNVNAHKGTFSRGTFIGLPHLSTYKIMKKEKYSNVIKVLFNEFFKN